MFGVDTQGYFLILRKNYQQYIYNIAVFFLYWEDPCYFSNVCILGELSMVANLVHGKPIK